MTLQPLSLEPLSLERLNSSQIVGFRLEFDNRVKRPARLLASLLVRFTPELISKELKAQSCRGWVVCEEFNSLVFHVNPPQNLSFIHSVTLSFMSWDSEKSNRVDSEVFDFTASDLAIPGSSESILVKEKCIETREDLKRQNVDQSQSPDLLSSLPFRESLSATAAPLFDLWDGFKKTWFRVPEAWKGFY